MKKHYFLLIGGAVVVAVIVIYIMIGLTGSSGNAANTIVQTGLQHIQGALGGDDTIPSCGNGVVDVSMGEVCDTALPGAACSIFDLSGTGLVPCTSDCTDWQSPSAYGCS